MNHDVKVPSVGESITEGVLASWAVGDGESVNKGDVLFELETDKATTEVPAPESGVVRHKVEAGAEVTIGAVVAVIESNGAAAAPAKKSEEKKSEDKKAEDKKAEAPPAKKEKAEVNGSGESDHVLATSVAKKVAEENKIDLAQVKGTGASGRITREDVEAAVAQRDKAPAPKAEAPAKQEKKPEPPKAPQPSSEGEVTREKMSLLRRRIAERLVEAQHTAAMLTTFNDVDMSAVLELRNRYKDAFKERHGVGLGFMSFFTAAAVIALREFPRINSMIDGTDIVTWHHQHIGIAVSTDKGLVVPVLRNAQDLTFPEIEAAVRDFAVRARDGKLELADMTGGTFTITNGGVFGSLLSTPILNPPQSAILGMHRIEERPVARDGQVVIRPMMYLALSYDHRLVDGREAVNFLVRIKDCIENPSRMLLDV